MPDSSVATTMALLCRWGSRVLPLRVGPGSSRASRFVGTPVAGTPCLVGAGSNLGDAEQVAAGTIASWRAVPLVWAGAEIREDPSGTANGPGVDTGSGVAVATEVLGSLVPAANGPGKLGTRLVGHNAAQALVDAAVAPGALASPVETAQRWVALLLVHVQVHEGQVRGALP